MIGRREWVEEGIAIYELLLRNRPEEVRFQYCLSQLLLVEGTREKVKNGNRRRALDLFLHLVSVYPNHREAHYHLGYLYFYEGNSEKDIHHFSKALHIGKLKKHQEIRSWISLAISYGKQGDFAEAWNRIDQASLADQEHQFIPEIEMAKMLLQTPLDKPYILQSKKEKRHVTKAEAERIYEESIEGQYALLNLSSSPFMEPELLQMVFAVGEERGYVT